MSAYAGSPLPSLVDLLLHRSGSEGARRLFTFLGDEEGEEETLSFAELDRRARRIAVALRERVPAGERVLLLYPPGLEYCAGFFGCLYAGVVAVPAYPPDPARLDRTLPRLRAIIQDAQASMVLTTSGILSMTEFVFEQAPDFRELHWLATDELPGGLEDGWSRPDGLDGDRLAFLQYTSGSTGTPKGVMLTHGNLMHNLGLISHAFGVRPRESVGVIWLPPYHDMGLIGGILQPLFAGIETALLSPLSFLRRPLRWLEALSRFRGTISGGPNFAFDLCVRKSTPEQRQGLDLSNWEVAFCGAEPIRAETLERFTEAFAPFGFRREALYPCYGLAEGTLIVTGGEAGHAPVLHTLDAGALARNRAVPARQGTTEARTFVGCGRTLPDQEVLVVDPETLEPCAAGQVGEVWVRGPSVARGYWRKPAETAHTFHARPARGEPAREYLRTGDLATLSESGEVLITGRLKDLIILRGRNHYPQDLELTVEQSHPALRPGCGAAFSAEVDGEERLVLVQELDTRVQVDPGEVVDVIRQRLSELHEVQLDALVLLEPGSIAKTSSGKIQRHACRAAFLSDALRAVHTWRRTDAPVKAPAPGAPAPRHEPVRADLRTLSTAVGIESWLVDRLAERLKVGPQHVNAHVPITRHGLDSLAAVELSHDIEQGLGVRLQMELLLQGPTLSQLAWQLFTLKSMVQPAPAAVAPLHRAPARRELPLTSAQQRVWLLEQREPGIALWNLPGVLRLEGPLDVKALERGFEELVRRHETLRTTFESRDGQPVQVVSPAARLPFEVVEVAPRPGVSMQEEALRVAEEDARQPFDLGRAPLLRARLLRLGAQEHLLVATMHHIVSDGGSMGVLLRELAALYSAFSAGRPSPLPEPSLQYGDYALWQRDWLQGEVLESQLSWWRGALAGAPPALELPTDHPRPSVQTYRGATRPVRLSRELSLALKEVCQREGVTPFMLLLAGFQAVLHRHSGQEDISVGTAIAGRTRAEFRELIGLFFNLVVLRTQLSGALPFRELLGRVREAALGAYAHQETPFEKLVEVLRPERSQRHSPLFQVLFVLQGDTGAPQLPGLRTSLVDVHTGVAAYELSLSLRDTAEGFTGSLEYNSGLFEAATVDRLVGHLRTLLEGIVAAPDRRLSELPLLTADERRLLLRDWNQTRTGYRGELSVPALFQEQARRTPDATAVRVQDASLTYRELDLRSDQVAAHLRSLGVGPEVRVALCVERSLDMVVGLLGVLKAGGAYVPLDPAYPRERLALMLEDSGAPVLVTQQHLAGGLPHVGQVLCLDALPAPVGDAAVDLRGGALPGNAAYVIYTSGSTGRPKGVVVQHRNILNFFAAMDARLEAPAEGIWLAVTSISFDISVLELLWTLSRGFQVVVAGTGEVDGLAAEIRRHRVTHLQCTPSLARALMQMPSAREALSTLKQLLVGGEALPPALAAELARVVPSVLNMYGPTETTVWSSTHPVDAGAGPVSIGTPIANTTFYILDALLQPVPVGVAGELYIGGEGVVRGYLGRPELTAERFIPDALGGEPGARLYRTGDVACWRANGTVEYLGRADFQVKVRGFRIELGEVEAVLCQHPAVAQAVVVAKDDAGSDKRLVAYAVPKPGQTFEAGTLRAFMQQRLPGYMVPSVFVTLEALPLTPNGKVDRKALPEPGGSVTEQGRPTVLPRTPTEQRVAASWGELLGLERVGIHDDFFELGGHSLMATQVVSRIRSAFGVELPLRVLFEDFTVAGLAQRVEAALRQEQGTQAPPIRPAPRPEKLPLSFAQERLWLFEQLHPDSAAYNMPCAVRLRGTLDVSALERSLEELERRHEALRTVFLEADGQPVQQILPARRRALPVVDLGALAESERDEQGRRLAREEAARPFDLRQGPLMRARLLRLGAGDHILCITLHHIVADGWSIGVFVRELAALYDAFSRAQPSPLRELPLQYADYSLWQQQWLQGSVLEQQLAYWTRQLDEVPRLQLRSDAPRVPSHERRGEMQRCTLPPDLVRELEALSRREGATLFMTLLATFNVLLHRYTGQSDLTVGTDIANRTRVEVEELIGLITNQLVMRTDVSGAPTFRELLGRVRRVAMDAYEHQDLPFEKLVRALKAERDIGGQPLFQVKFVLENAPLPAQQLAGLRLTPMDSEGHGAARWDLLIILVPGEEGLTATLEYATDLFDTASASRLWAHFTNLARAVVKEPGRRISELPLLTEEERRQLLRSNATTDSSREVSVAELFEAWAASTPESVAVTFEGQQLTYAELNRRANQLAHHLRLLGLSRGGRVGICVERSVEMVVGLLAILKAGGSYVPLDPSYPSERLAYIIEDARLPFILTQSHLEDALPAQWAQVICLDLEERTLARQPAENPGAGSGGDAEIYVLYTSGSTGKPKGVAATHRGVVRLVVDSNYVSLSAADTLLQLATLAFDASTFEIWGALLNGARLAVFPPRAPSLEDLAALIERERVSTLWLTAGLFHQVADADLAGLGSVRQLLAGGDVLSPPQVLKLMERYPGCTVINGYGPTENTTFTCCYPVRERSALRTTVPIGHAISDTQVYLLNEALEPVPLGAPGELFTGGAGVALGYLNQPELTAERFIPDPFSQRPGARMYRTGDLCRYRRDGSIEFLGRMDQQVKIRGFRIEPGEVEAALRQHPSISEVVVVVRELAGEKALVAYAVPSEGASLTMDGVRLFLREKLPAFMVPSALVVLESLPLTVNGKVDRRALPEVSAERPQLSVAFEQPRTAREEVLAAVWADVLGLESVGSDDNFFALGGDSLRSIQIVARCRARGIELSVGELLAHQTIRELAQRMGGNEADVPAPESDLPFALISPQERERLPEDVENAYPVSMLQAGMLFRSEYNPEEGLYLDAFSFHLRLPLDVNAFQEAVRWLVVRHPVLRTSFNLVDHEEPLQRVHRTAEVPLHVGDVRHLDADAQKTFLATWLEQERCRPFDWTRAPLLRLALHRRTDETVQFSAIFHHAILDGWSVASLFTELFERYLAPEGKEAPELATSFQAFIALERQALQSEKSGRYFQQLLEDASRSRASWLESRRSEAAPAFHEQTLALPEGLHQGLRRLARTTAVPLKSVLLAAHLRVMGWIEGTTDIVTGLVSNGRPEVQDGERILGLFLNTVPFRLPLSGGTWSELVQATFSREQEQVPHRRYPLARLQQQNGGTPLFTTLFNYVHFHVYGGLSQLKGLELVEVPQLVARLELPLSATFSVNPLTSELHLVLRCTGVDTARVEELARYYVRTLERMALEPESRYEQSTLLSEAELRQLLVEWNSPRREELPQATLPQLFSEQARRTPEAPAVICGEAHLSFGQLEAQANQLAHRLRSLGVGPDSPVVLCLERSVEALVAIFGTLKAGGAYVPIDPSYPAEWKAHVLQDTRARVILTQRHLVRSLPACDAQLLCLDAGGDSLADERTDAPQVPLHPDLLAYVIYTSGSTGRPKGVMITHRSALHLRQALAATVHATSSGPERVSLNAPLSFDASVKQLLQVLDGHTLCFVPEEDRGDIARMLRRIEQDELNVLDCSPAHLRLLVAEGLLERARTLRRVLVGGEAVDAATWAQLATHPRIRFFNVYGPTECTVDATACAFEASPDAPSIGRPLPGVPVYVLDAALQPVPVGVPGELFIGGPQVARGYLHRPELSADRFIPDAFSDTPGARLYRTGDRVRWSATGQLEYLQRLDHQVKVRGFRIELAEVESTLLQHPALKQAVVVARGEGTDKRLVAYVVPLAGHPLENAALKAYLGQRLPEYMVPSVFVLLEALPLTTNGKVNSKALPEPDLQATSEYIAPRSEVETRLAILLAEVLRVPRMGVRDDFFALGGHSLLATQALSRIRNAFQIELPLRSLFEAPTVEGLAKRVEQARLEGGTAHLMPLTRQPRVGPLPLSFAQQRLWFLDQLRPGDISYNIPAALRLLGPLDAEALRRAFEEVVRRHEALRTTFSTAHGAPQQLIHPPPAWSLPVVDLSSLPADQRQAQALALAQQEAQRPFHLSTGPLLRTQLLKLDSDEHVLVLNMHHIVSDGWSTGVLVREVAALYAAFTRGQPSPLPELAVQYADYALWQRSWLKGAALQAQLDYWRQQLQGVPALQLPTDKSRPALQSFRGDALSFSISAPVAASLNQLAHQSGTTLFMVLLASWQALLSRYSEQRDISVGTPIAGRTRQETESLIGFFVNTLVLRTRLEPDASFLQLLAHVKEVCLGAFSHQDVPFEQLVEELGVVRDMSRTPLFQVAFALQNAPMQPPSLSGVKVEPVAAPTHTAKFDLTLVMVEREDGLEGQLEYCVDLFERASIQRLAGHFQSLLEGLAANAHRALSQLPPEGPLQLPPLRPQAPSTQPVAAAEFVAPSTPLEESLAALWTEVLGVANPSVHDNFFQRGGNSLTSALLLARVQQALGVDVSLKHFFETPSIAALAALVQAGSQPQPGSLAPPVTRQPRVGPLPLSFSQQRLWFLDQLRPGDTSYNIPAALRIEGDLNREAFEKALVSLVQRHESLRTHFSSTDAGPVQVISEDAPRVTRIDLSSLAEAAREAEVQRLIAEEAARPFDLSRGPLVRMVLLELEPREHILQCTMHHSIFDGWSTAVMVQEMVVLYQAFAAGQEPSLPALPVQYADYAVWQRQWMQGDVLEAQLDYWRQKLAEAPSLLDLPTDRPRPAVLSFRGARRQERFPQEITSPLYELAHQEKATPFMVLMAAFQVLLSRYSGQDDISVGSPISGRTRPELEGLVGFFANTLVLRAHVEARASFRELLRQTRDSALEAYAHQDVPFERLVEALNPQRSLGHTPLFQVMLVLQNLPQARLELPGLAFHILEAETQATKFDLTLMLNDEPEGLAATLKYNAELFDAATVQRLVGHLRMLFVAAASQPDVPLSQLSLLTGAERNQLLVEWNSSRREELPQATLPQLFSEQARRTPEALAVICGERHLSFGQLESQANQLAHRLRSLGVGPDSPVVLCMERSVEALVAIFGTLKAGGAYVPIDPSYPAEWKAHVLQGTRARVILTQRHLVRSLPACDAQLLCLGAGGDSLADERTDAPQVPLHPDLLAYVIYTSGSTGRPKGVMITHRSALHLRQALAATVHATSSGPERVSVNAPLSFDASVKQLLQVLDGHTLCFVPEEDRCDIARMLRRIEQDELNVLDCSPAHLRLLVAEGLLERARTLRRVLVGGEAVDAATWAQLATHPRIRFFNVYGPTECTVDATSCGFDSSPEAPSIGRPLPGVPVYVLDAALQPVPVGVPGELFIGGPQVARGYLHRPELSAERFIPDAFSGTPGARMYRTGDRVRWSATGQLEYLQRLDHQVKVRGFRIELGEVESALLQHPALKQAVVVARAEGIDTRLVAYVVAREPGAQAPDAAALRDFLRQRLPEHMVPSAFMLLEALPLTANGKLDRRALPAPTTARGEDRLFIAPHTPVQQALALIWERLLHVDRVGLADNFFTLGGHSLLATQALSRIRNAFQIELPLRSLFEAPTLEELAKRVEQAQLQGGSAHLMPLTRQPRVGALPLSFAQQRLWFLDQLRPGDISYNIPAALRLLGPLDAEALRRAFEEVVRRHEALRTTFSTAHGAPQQLIHPPPAWSLPVVDLTSLPADQRQAQALALARQEAQRPFHLSTGPLLRTQLLKLDSDEHVLVLCKHHIVSDGWSTGVLVREVVALYAAFTQGQPSPLPELAVQYADYALWQRSWLQGATLQAQLDYWRQQLQGVPALQLPTDKSRPALQSFRGDALSFSISAPVAASLNQLAHQSGTTLFMVLLASWQALLSRYSEQRDISVGTPIAGRTRQETESLIGFFVNTLVLRTRLEPDASFLHLLAHVKEVCLGAFSHQDVPFEQLVEELGVVRDMSRTPLFQVAFALQNAPMQPPSLSGVKVEPVAAPTHTAKFDLTLVMVEREDGLEGQLEYCVDLFERASIQRLAGHFQSLLEGLTANAHRALSQLPPEGPLQLPPLRPLAPSTQPVAVAEFVAPSTPLEESVAALWTEVLGVANPSVHDNFFQRGGNSLTSALLLARVQQALGADVSLKHFFESPSIAALAALVAETQPGSMLPAKLQASAGSPLVLLNQGGTQTPIFCIHAVSGEVFSYVELARRLGEDQPLYGVRAQDAHEAPQTDPSIPSMAASYLETLQRQQPTGPYRLMGWSMGGDIAFEMARQLEARGEKVELLALIDAYAHPFRTLPAGRGTQELVAELLAAEFQSLAEHLDESQLAAMRQTLERNLQAISAYRPGTYGGEVVLLQATEVFKPGIQEQDNGWRPLASAGIKVHAIPGNHHSILRPPNVDALAAQLRACLRELPERRDSAAVAGHSS